MKRQAKRKSIRLGRQKPLDAHDWNEFNGIQSEISALLSSIHIPERKMLSMNAECSGATDDSSGDALSADIISNEMSAST